jgi:hypothetical protein
MLSGNDSNNYQNLFSAHSNRDPGTKATVRELENRVNRLELITEALWNLLQSKTDLSENDLLDAVTQVDLSDGRYDRKKQRPTAIDCPRCKRKINKNHTHCLYCGEALLVGPFA